MYLYVVCNLYISFKSKNKTFFNKSVMSGVSEMKNYTIF